MDAGHDIDNDCHDKYNDHDKYLALHRQLLAHKPC